MKRRTKSNCPLCYSLDVFGDKWTLLVIRDLLLGGKRHYGDFLKSSEGISTNILADRLKLLVAQGLVTRTDDPDNRGQAVYAPTGKATALLPVLDARGKWALAHGPRTLALPPLPPG